ncbi:MAG: GAF domain-containing protein [Ignavibacteriaceae bacterium]
MAETTINVNKNLSLEETYKSLIPQVKSLLVKEDELISSLANFTAALKQTFDKISWVGFYLFDGEKLYLGPFQGKTACTAIEIGKGVCGTAVLMEETVIVPDVNDFPGHIACDPDAKSEIVVPIMKEARLIGVLDLDSSSLDAFDETDQKYLEELCQHLADEFF